jgi:hypothetical protein
VAQALECLLCKWEALSSNPSLTKNKIKNKNAQHCIITLEQQKSKTLRTPSVGGRGATGFIHYEWKFRMVPTLGMQLNRLEQC